MKKLETVLLIDDDVVANFLHFCIIEELEIAKNTEAVTNGFEALDYLKKNNPPSLILLDLNMPGLGGFEFLEYYNNLKFEQKKDTKIIILSSSKRIDDITLAMDLGALDYIVKPASTAKIKEIYEEYFLESHNYTL